MADLLKTELEPRTRYVGAMIRRYVSFVKKRGIWGPDWHTPSRSVPTSRNPNSWFKCGLALLSWATRATQQKKAQKSRTPENHSPAPVS